MFAPVQGVLAAPPTTGLVASAARPITTDSRWESGLAWVPERCGLGYQLVPWCTTSNPAAYTEPRAGSVYYRPVGARFADECSTLGGQLDTERFRRQVTATTPFVIARELWDGELSQTDSYVIGGVTLTNSYLASSEATEVTTTATGLPGALAALEHAAVEASRGQRVMLHVPTLLTGTLGEYVRRVGTDLLTRQDNLVVVDAGYPGTGPAGEPAAATAWAYATSVVEVRQSPIQLITDPTHTVDRATNTVTAWAELVFAATFDPCCHFAIEITV